MSGVDTAAWPVVVVHGEGRVDEEAARALVDDFAAAVARARAGGERIGLVQDVERLDRAANDLVQAWWFEHLAELGEVVAAAASVVAPATVERNRALIEEHAGAYPFAAWCAATRDDCVEWVRGRL